MICKLPKYFIIYIKTQLIPLGPSLFYDHSRHLILRDSYSCTSRAQKRREQKRFEQLKTLYEEKYCHNYLAKFRVNK